MRPARTIDRETVRVAIRSAGGSLKDAAESLGMATDEMMMVLSYDLKVMVVPHKSTARMRAVQTDDEKLTDDERVPEAEESLKRE